MAIDRARLAGLICFRSLCWIEATLLIMTVAERAM